MSGNVKLALSHVVPDLVLKVLKGQDPLHILGEGHQVRHYTYGGDLAHGHPDRDGVAQAAVNEDFNVSTAASTTVLELAEVIWNKIHGDGRPFRYVTDPPVRARRPAAGARRAQGPRRPGLRGDHLALARCWTRSSPGSRHGAGGGPAVTEGGGDLDRVYRVRFGEGESRGRYEVWTEVVAFLSRWIPRDCAVLDVACDRGYFIRNVPARERWATDIRDLSSVFDGSVQLRPGRRPRARIGAADAPTSTWRS